MISLGVLKMIGFIKGLFKKKQKNNSEIIENPKKEMPILANSTTAIPVWKELWDTCIIDENAMPKVKYIADKMLANKSKYEEVEKLTSVPWDVIAVIHNREASMDFAGVLHNGEKILGTGKKTKKVPKGRGPFNAWTEAAVDALVMDGATKIKDWSIENTFKFLERFNGLGYRRTGEYSPYICAGTNHHDETGKYVADGKFDRNAVEKQLGAMAILKFIRS